MTSSAKISVVIPFYNETAFLTTAVHSVLSQKIEDVEIIIVNDNPAAFKDEYFDSLSFPDTVRVVHHVKNRGLPSGRNTGINAAKGEYIAFLDADDYYLPLGLRNHLDYAVQQGADITHAQTVITHVNKVSGDIISTDATFLGAGARGRYEEDDVIEAGFYIESSWASIYKADFLDAKRVRFDESQIKFEDRIFVIEALLAADSLAILGKPCRVWRKRNDSITTSAKSHADQLLKLDLVRKSVTTWLEKSVENGRYHGVRELVRQVGYMITGNKSSPWFGLFGFSDDAGDLKLSEMLSEYFENLGVTENEISDAFGARSPRYNANKTGNGKIKPYDMFRLINLVACRDYDVVRAIINEVVVRPIPFALPRLSQPQAMRGKHRILLHLGLHKTGSTHIQYQLAENRKL